MSFAQAGLGKDAFEDHFTPAAACARVIGECFGQVLGFVADVTTGLYDLVDLCSERGALLGVFLMEFVGAFAEALNVLFEGFQDVTEGFGAVFGELLLLAVEYSVGEVFEALFEVHLGLFEGLQFVFGGAIFGFEAFDFQFAGGFAITRLGELVAELRYFRY